MKATYKRQFYMGTIGDAKNLEPQFADMAKQGWLIDKVGTHTLRYRAIEPCSKHFFVDFLPHITVFDYPENENARYYRHTCGELGWTFVAANRQLHIFCADESLAKPPLVHTDNRAQAKIYLEMSRRYELFNIGFILLLFGFSMFSQLRNIGARLFLSNISIFMLLGCLIFIVGFAWTFGFILNWYRRTWHSVRHNLPLPAVNPRLARVRIKMLAIGTLGAVFLMTTGLVIEFFGGNRHFEILIIASIPLVLFGVGIWLKRLIDTKLRSRNANILLTVIAIFVMLITINIIVFSALHTISTQDRSGSIGDRPTISLYSVGISYEPEHIHSFVEGSIAVPIHYSHWETNQHGSVSTEVYRPVNSLIAQMLYRRLVMDFEQRHKNAEYRGFYTVVTHLTQSQIALLGADKGIVALTPEHSSTDFLLLEGRTILRISVSGEDIDEESILEAVQEFLSFFHNNV